MVIDSKQYNGPCACGRTHEMTTQYCIIESGCLKDVTAYMRQYGMHGYCVAVYDENTYKATADRHPQVDLEVVLPAEDLHANEHGVALLMEKLPEDAIIMIAVGSGTVHDISRYCAYQRQMEFVSCPTAASVDGFCSSVAAMTWNGCKKTLTAVAPKIVVADLDIIRNAPIRLAKSGFGDMVGKYIALTDWKISNLLTGEFYCKTIAEMTYHATENVLSSAEGIVLRNVEAYEKLMYGLLLSGLAMQMMGNSRPASGAEHHISHLIEMSPPLLSVKSDALHGEKVGVGTLLALREYKRLAKLPSPTFSDYVPVSNELIRSIFGEEMSIEIFAENKNNCASQVTGTMLSEKWKDLCAVIEDLPTPEQLSALYSHFGIKSTLPDIDVSQALSDALLNYSHLVRNRLTLMRVRGCISNATPPEYRLRYV